MSRGALVGLIYNRVHDVWTDSSHKGAAVTLMSTDADNLSGVIEMVIDLSGHATGVTIGLLMLFKEVGWLCMLPLLMILCKS
jgi:ATP-binding cassette, subfamily C (CFTR/MRP), member 1